MTNHIEPVPSADLKLRDYFQETEDRAIRTRKLISRLKKPPGRFKPDLLTNMERLCKELEKLSAQGRKSTMERVVRLVNEVTSRVAELDECLTELESSAGYTRIRR